VNLQRTFRALSIGTGVVVSTLTVGLGLANIPPLDPPPPCPTCQPGPATPGGSPPPSPEHTTKRFPCVGPGNPRGGGGQPICPN